MFTKIRYISGTVEDTLYQETLELFGGVPDEIPRLAIAFDEGVHHKNTLICSVPIPDRSIEARFLKPGDKVTCTIQPAPAGYQSKLVSAARL